MAACGGGTPATDVPQPTETATTAIRYVALGDSYTIGTGVATGDRFPDQLVARLGDRLDVELVANLGVNGYSSDDLIEHELPALDELQPDFVTLLIGVNDVVRGVPLDGYRANVDLILGRILGHVPVERIVVVSIPDYTMTPAGGNFGDPIQQSAAIAQANEIMRAATDLRGIAFVDISSVAGQVRVDRSLVAGDGLHPSGAQYAKWVDLIEPVVLGLFR